MNLELLFAHTLETTIRVAVIGAGEFGATIVDQIVRTPGVCLSVICDRDLTRAIRAARTAGIAPEVFVPCDGRSATLAAVMQGKVALIEDIGLLDDLPLNVVVEATGNPEAGTAVALKAIANGMHSVLATKEAEALVGPILKAKAKAAGLVHTTIDGDQPATLISLLSRARVMGLTVVAAGKSTAWDLVWDPATDGLSVHGRTYSAEGFGRWFRTGETDVASAMRNRVVEGLPHTLAPDLCELTVVANHTGLQVDRPDMHAPIARAVELPCFFRPASEGGLLDRIGVVDQFTCLRRPDELSFAGGVFVVVEAPTKETGRVLGSIGIPASPDGKYVLLHNPIHLLGVESPISVLAAARLGMPTGGVEVSQRFDMTGYARRDLAAGERLEFGSEHNITALDHRIEPAVRGGDGQPIPYWLAGGRTLKAPVKAGDVLRYEHVDLPADSLLAALRREQDETMSIPR